MGRVVHANPEHLGHGALLPVRWKASLTRARGPHRRNLTVAVWPREGTAGAARSPFDNATPAQPRPNRRRRSAPPGTACDGDWARAGDGRVSTGAGVECACAVG